jgi:hypothetical protein
MSTPQRAALFHRPGPEATLQYLWSRLQSRDLTGAEALAMLGALHHDLGQSKAQEPKVYCAYSRFMESLDKQMPAVHHYVVAAWTENRYARRQQITAARPAETYEVLPEISPTDEVPHNAAVTAAPVLHPAVVAGEGAEVAEEPGEPAEDDEDDPAEVRKAVTATHDSGGEEQDDDESESEPESEDKSKPDEDDLEDEAPEDDVLESSAQQEEASESVEAEDQAQESAQDEDSGADETPDAEESESDVEVEPEEGNDLQSEASEQGTVAEGADSGEEEREWPQEEEREIDEPLEGFGGEGEEPAGVD